MATLTSRERMAWGLALFLALMLAGTSLHRRHSGSSLAITKPITWSVSEADRNIASAQSTLKENPEDLGALTDLAVGYFSKGPDFYVEGMNALERARGLGATSPALFYYAGVMYAALGLPEYAENDLQRYLRHRPQDYDARIRLANLFFRQDKTDEAYAAYKDALKNWPKDPTVIANYAVVATAKGDYDAAEKALAEAERQLGRVPPGAAFTRGEIARLKGDDKTAIERYQQELSSDPVHLPSLQALEQALKRQGDNKGARAIRSRIQEVKKPNG